METATGAIELEIPERTSVLDYSLALASAGVLTTAMGNDLRLPGILAGSLGNAIGTYAGFLVAVWLR